VKAQSPLAVSENVVRSDVTLVYTIADEGGGG
jgi:hypothetical protein